MKDLHGDLDDRIGRADDEASRIWLVLNTDKPSPTSDMKTAALNDRRSLFNNEFVKSFFYKINQL